MEAWGGAQAQEAALAPRARPARHARRAMPNQLSAEEQDADDRPMGFQERDLRQLQLRSELRLPVQLAEHPWILSVGLRRQHRRRPFQRDAAGGSALGGTVQMARRDQGRKRKTPDRYR